MAGSIRGSWPGGPKREGPKQERSGPPRLERVEDMEARAARWSIRRKRGARTRRLALGIAASAALAGGFGWLLGLRSHTTADVLMDEQVSAEQATTGSSEINRVMLELWRMEDVEYSRNRRR